jgi:hypothetical protein
VARYLGNHSRNLGLCAGIREAQSGLTHSSFFEAFCHSNDALVYVVYDPPLLFEFVLQGWGAWFGVLELIAEIVVGLLETPPMTGLIAVSLADHEA